MKYFCPLLAQLEVVVRVWVSLSGGGAEGPPPSAGTPFGNQSRLWGCDVRLPLPSPFSLLPPPALECIGWEYLCWWAESMEVCLKFKGAVVEGCMVKREHTRCHLVQV